VQTAGVRISAKADYAVRAVIELAGASSEAPLKGEAVATAQAIPLKFLENILGDLRHSGIIASRRGAEGGYWLAQAPDAISVADIIRAVEGPMATVRGERPENIAYEGNAEPLKRVWIAVRAALRGVAENVTVADLADGDLPMHVQALADDPEAWVSGR
jgi:Rrf2 family protein